MPRQKGRARTRYGKYGYDAVYHRAIGGYAVFTTFRLPSWILPSILTLFALCFAVPALAGTFKVGDRVRVGSVNETGTIIAIGQQMRDGGTMVSVALDRFGNTTVGVWYDTAMSRVTVNFQTFTMGAARPYEAVYANDWNTPSSRTTPIRTPTTNCGSTMPSTCATATLFTGSGSLQCSRVSRAASTPPI